MAGKTFAAINVGSNEISMKICEITPRKGARELDTVKTIIELGSDTYNKGYIEENNLNKLCDTLIKFRRKMKEYDVSDYRAYASSAVREAENASMIIERIKMCTDFDVQILSNSEQRFMNYKAFVATGMDVDVATHKRIMHCLISEPEAYRSQSLTEEIWCRHRIFQSVQSESVII